MEEKNSNGRAGLARDDSRQCCSWLNFQLMPALWDVESMIARKISFRLRRAVVSTFLLFFLDLVNKVCSQQIKYPETELKLPPLSPHQPLVMGFLGMGERGDRLHSIF